MKNNLLIPILVQLNMKHSMTFTSQYLNEHPHKYNMFGISSMLSDYGIANAGIKVLDKKQVHSIEVPFIAHTGNNFVIVQYRSILSIICYKDRHTGSK